MNIKAQKVVSFFSVLFVSMLFLTLPKSASAGWVARTCSDISTSASGSDWSKSAGYINFNTSTCVSGYPGSDVPMANLTVFFNRNSDRPNTVYFRSTYSSTTRTSPPYGVTSETVNARSGTATFRERYSFDRNWEISPNGTYDYSVEFSDGYRLSYTLTTSGSGATGLSIAYTNIQISTQDNTAPSLTSLNRNTPSASQTDANTLRWEVKFDEDVVNVDASDFILSGTTAVLSVSGSGDTYYVTASGGDLASLNGQVTISLAGANNIQDEGANALNASSTSSSYSVDNTTLVTNVSSSAADDHYRTGTIPIGIEFQRAVTVVGNPQLLLETGSVDRVATYTSGSGTSKLVFNYAISSGDVASDLDYNSTTALSLNGGSLTDTNSLAPILTLASPGASGSLSANSAIIIDTTPPVVTDANISLAGATGTGGAFKVGDTVTASWDTSGSDGDTNITSSLGDVSVDFSAFGGGSSVNAGLSGTTWSATYAVVANASTSSSNLNVSVTATDKAGNITTVADTSNATVDAVPPVVTAANISLSGATGTGGAFKIGDAVTATWDSTASGDNNADIASASFDFTQFGGSSVAAAQNSGTWTASYTVISGAIDTANRNVDVTAIDTAGNSSNQAGTNNTVVDNISPTVADGDISVSGGTGPSGAFKVGDTVTVAWTANNTDTVDAVTIDFSDFGGAASLQATESSGVWTATFVLPAGSLSSNSLQVEVTAYDNAGNPLTTNKATVYTANTIAPTVVVAGPTEIVTEQFIVHIEFSEAVSSDLIVSELRVENGSVASVVAVAGSSTEFTADIEPILGNTVLVQVSAGAVTNIAGGNLNSASNEFTVFAGNVQSAFDEYREEIRQVLVDEAQRSLRSTVSANQNLVRGARQRFMAARLTAQACLDQAAQGNAVRPSVEEQACIDIADQSNQVPFDVDGTASFAGGVLSTRGTFGSGNGDASTGTRRLFFGDVDIQRDADGSTTATLNARRAWEQMLSDQTMFGYFAGGSFANSNIAGAFAGSNTKFGVEAGVYAVHQLGEALNLGGFATLGIGQNDLETANDVLALESDYTTKTGTIGASLSGVIVENGLELHPELAFSYGKTWIGDVGFTGTAYGLTDDTLSLDAGSVALGNMTLRTELIVPLDGETVADSNTQFSFSPRLICEYVKTTSSSAYCGGGAEIGLSSASDDGLSTANIKLIMDRIDNGARSSVQLGLEHNF